jgi:hypothetical protein
LEHRASVKRFVGRAPWMGYQHVARPLPIQTQNKHKHPCFEWVSNTRSQRSSELRQFMSYSAGPP